MKTIPGLVCLCFAAIWMYKAYKTDNKDEVFHCITQSNIYGVSAVILFSL